MPNCSGASLGDEALDDGDHVVGVAAPSHSHGEGLYGVLVEDVQQHQPPAIGGPLELEVERPCPTRPAPRSKSTFDFLDHRLDVAKVRGDVRSLDLEDRPITEFYDVPSHP